jgi:hypothetical protein
MNNANQACTIPGVMQRILINKKQPFSASSAAARCFKRGSSQNKVQGNTSLFGASSLSTNTSFSSFADASTRVKREQ